MNTIFNRPNLIAILAIIIGAILMLFGLILNHVNELNLLICSGISLAGLFLLIFGSRNIDFY